MPNDSLRSSCRKSFQSLASFLCLLPGMLYAQKDPDLRYLLFDPVPITVEIQADDDSSYVVQELRPRPDDGEGIDLQSWLAARLSNGSRDQEQVERDIERYNNLIAALEATHGPFGMPLAEELLGLAALQSAIGADDVALQLYQRALHIVRVNNGLYSRDQEQIVSRIIATHLARGDLMAADREQEFLFHLQRRNASEQKIDTLLEPLRNQANWNFFTFSAFSTPMPMYESMLAPNLDRSFVQNSQELTSFRAQGLLRAQSRYQQMIDLIKEKEGPNDPKLPALLLDLSITCFHYLSNFNINDDITVYQQLRPYDMGNMPVNSLCSRAGRQALDERAKILEVNGAAPVERLQAKLDLVDWLLYFNKRGEALSLLQANAQLSGEETFAALLNPPMPMSVPTFIPDNYSRALYHVPENLTLEYKGYVDVEFVVTQLGAARAIKVLGKSADTPSIVEDRLTRHIRRSQFRPRLTEDGLLNPDLARIRYYYTY